MTRMTTMTPGAIRALFSTETPNDLFTLLTFSTTFSATDMVVGEEYVIDSVGTTNFVTHGSASNTVGTVFVCTSVGVGTGTVTKEIRLCDSYLTRLSENSSDVVYGVVSRSKNYVFLPLEITLPQEEEAQAPRCSIVMRDVTRYLIPVIRELKEPPKVKLELVLSSTPDVVEVSFDGFYVTNFNYNRDQVTCELQMVNYEREPFPVHSFSPATFPRLF